MRKGRSDAARNREAILEAAARLFRQSRATTLADVAAAARVSRSTVYRHFESREALESELASRPTRRRPAEVEDLRAPGQLGRGHPVPLEAIHVFDAVSPAVLPDQLVAEAQRLAKVPLALYVLDIDGTYLLRVAGPARLPERLEAPFAIGPELDAQGLAVLRERLVDVPGTEVVPLWLRGRATGVLITLGRPEAPLGELARQASAAIALADRYTDTFAGAQRRKQPRAAAEIQQSLLPPRISRVTGGEVAGNVLPSYEVAGDWFDVVENLDGVWITLADGLGGSTRATASAAVALGGLRAARRSGAGIAEALLAMHTTLKEMPGPRAEMTAVATRWDPATQRCEIASCGHLAPVLLPADREGRVLALEQGHGLGGRANPRPAEVSIQLGPGDRLLICSDGVVEHGGGRAGLGVDGLLAAVPRSTEGAAETVRSVHRAVLRACDGQLGDDATVVCLAVG